MHTDDESAFSVTSQHGEEFGQLIYTPALQWDGVTVATTDSPSGEPVNNR